MREAWFKRLLFWINIPLMCLALGFGLVMVGGIYVREKVHQAVIVSPTTPLLEGPQKHAQKQMELHEGLKIRVLNEVGDYARVRLPIGVEGFIQSSHLGGI